tara:strand:+ start:2827 stop:3006 length:180 start_codon:yes stop_codon:yes gene_type:complete
MKIGETYIPDISDKSDWKGEPYQYVTPCIVCGEWRGVAIVKGADKKDMIKCKCQRGDDG